MFIRDIDFTKGNFRPEQVALSEGDGWVMVGDAWGFLDPLYSSGVLLALKSGEYAEYYRRNYGARLG